MDTIHTFELLWSYMPYVGVILLARWIAEPWLEYRRHEKRREQLIKDRVRYHLEREHGF